MRTLRGGAAEDLIIHKIISERPRDREDVEGVFRRQGSSLDFACLDRIVHELGKALIRSDMVDFYQAWKRSVQG